MLTSSEKRRRAVSKAIHGMSPQQRAELVVRLLVDIGNDRACASSMVVRHEAADATVWLQGHGIGQPKANGPAVTGALYRP